MMIQWYWGVPYSQYVESGEEDLLHNLCFQPRGEEGLSLDLVAGRNSKHIDVLRAIIANEQIDAAVTFRAEMA